jgi:hypothetical protein
MSVVFTCPACGRGPLHAPRPDGTGEPIAPGDVTACPGCLAVLIADEGGRHRPMTAAERAEMERDDPGIAAALYAYQARLAAGRKGDGHAPGAGEGGAT